MKLHKDQHEVERGGVGGETTFNFKTSAKAFDILSTGLYTDNILAIVRELSCNAYDAHVDAGKGDLPFEIHLPNNLEPWFGVKDFGVGLSDEDVRTVYTTYFDSTKTDSNDYIGALGLGSKSPFSYVHSYQVISRYDGYRRTYAVFINEEGIPTIAQMGETMVTDECNGLEVTVTVQAEDFRKFADKTAEALKWFPVKPQIKGSPHFNFQELPSSTLEGSDWKLLPRSRFSDPPMTAVQGNVAYRVDTNQLSNMSDDLERIVQQSHLVAFFDIGELEVAASREEIRYDKRSVHALEKRVEAFRTELIKSLEDRVSHLSTNKMWDAFVKLDRIVIDMFGSRMRLDKLIPDINQTNSKILRAYLECSGRFTIPRCHGHQLWLYRIPSTGSRIRLVRERISESIRPDSKTLFFYNDLKNGGVSRMNQYLNENRSMDDIFVVVPVSDPQKPVTKLEYDNFTGQNEEVIKHEPMTDKEVRDEYRQLVRAIGNPDFKTVSVDAPHVPRQKRSNKGLLMYKYDGYRNHRHRHTTFDWALLDNDEIDDLDIDAGGIYMPLRAKSKPNNGSYRKSGDLDRIQAGSYAQQIKSVIEAINEVKGTNYRFDQMVHVGKNTRRTLNKKGWISVIDAIADVVPSYHNGLAFLKQRRATTNVDDLGIVDLLVNSWDNRNNKKTVLGRFINSVYNLDHSSPFRQQVEPVIDQFNKYWPMHARLEAIQTLCSALEIKGLPDNDDPLYQPDRLFDTYPMLTFVRRIGERGNTFRDAGRDRLVDIDRLFDYISTIDRAQGHN